MIIWQLIIPSLASVDYPAVPAGGAHCSRGKKPARKFAVNGTKSLSATKTTITTTKTTMTTITTKKATKTTITTKTLTMTTTKTTMTATKTH